MNPRAPAVLLALTALLASTVAAAQTEPPPDAHRTGFMLEGRIAQSLGPTILLASSGSAVPLPTAAPAPVTAGYRGASWALGVGPSFLSLAVGSGSAATVFGLTVHVEFDVARVLARRGEGYVLLGATTAFSSPPSGSGQALFGVFAGFGARYWVAPLLGASLEIGEGYLTGPGSGADHFSTLNTFGTLGLVVVLGE